MRDLTNKERLFVHEYLACGYNATQAAIRAGYRKRSAGTYGHELLKKHEIAVAIAEAMDERIERTKIDADWLLERIAREAEADAADLYDENGALLPVDEWPEIWRQGLVAGMDVETLRDDDGTPIGTLTKIRLSDRVKRLEMLGKHVNVQAFRDRIEQTGMVTNVTITAEEYKKARSEMLNDDDC